MSGFNSQVVDTKGLSQGFPDISMKSMGYVATNNFDTRRIVVANFLTIATIATTLRQNGYVRKPLVEAGFRGFATIATTLRQTLDDPAHGLRQLRQIPLGMSHVVTG